MMVIDLLWLTYVSTMIVSFDSPAEYIPSNVIITGSNEPFVFEALNIYHIS